MDSQTKAALDSRPITPGVRVNKFPSTAHYDSKGGYVPDPLNQPSASLNYAAHDNGQLEHIAKPGYCEKHKQLGCDRCA
jgi:hypothetical protein